MLAAEARKLDRAARAERAAPPHHLSTLAVYFARTAAGGSVRNHRPRFGAARPRASREPSAPRQRRRKVIPGQQALEFTHQFAQRDRPKPADGVIYCDAPVAIPAHRAMAAALDASIIVMALAVFGIVFRLAGGAFVFNAKTRSHLSGRGGGRGDLLPIAVVPGQWRHGRPKVDASAAGEFRRPDAHARATVLPHCVGLLELDGRRHRIAVGPGGRRDAHLARPYLEDLPDAGGLERKAYSGYAEARNTELASSCKVPRSPTWIPCCSASANPLRRRGSDPARTPRPAIRR